MESDFSIRPAIQGDAAQILECLFEAFAPFRDSYTQDAFIDTVLTPDKLRDRQAAMHLLVATDSLDNVIGTIGYEAHEAQGHIRGMAVRLSWQGRGVAQELLNHAERSLRSSGCTLVTLGTTRPLQRAIRFYEKNGYRPTGQVSEFFGMELIEYAKQYSSQP